MPCFIRSACTIIHPESATFFTSAEPACFSASFEGRVHLQILHVRAMLQCSQFPVKEITNRILTPMTIFDLSSLMLLALSVCFTDSSYLILLGKTLIFFLLLHLFLCSFYEDRHWDIFTYVWAMIKTVFSSLAFLARPFTDLTAYVKNRRNIQTSHTDNRRVLSIVIGLTVALLALPVILLLLGSADAVFANLFQDAWNVFEGIMIHGDILTILVMFLFGFFLSYCLLCRLQTPNLKEAPSCQKEDPVIAITFTSIFSVIYVLFCVIQIVYLLQD